jgi:hypothetical protein
MVSSGEGSETSKLHQVGETKNHANSMVRTAGAVMIDDHAHLNGTTT